VLTLGIDTSTPLVSVALASAGSVVPERRDELVHNGHGEVLAGLIDDVLRAAGASATDLDAVGVGLGPGPFTGLRVGIVTAAAISDALRIPAYGMCSLDAIPSKGGARAVMTDARRRQVYWAVYDEHGRRAEGPEISAPTDLVERFRGEGIRIVGSADGVDEQRWPDAGVIAGHALDLVTGSEPAAPLTPMYLRRPDAREPGPPKRVTPT